jgi:heme/copper-type cytochrome/quinol oxidase subunit 4
MKKFLLSFFLFSISLLFPLSVLASDNLEQTLHGLSLKLVLLTTGIAAFVFLMVFLTKNRESLKKYFFFSIIIPVILTSLYLAGSTIYLNQVSSTGGPVHWHADFEIFDCGKAVDLVNPTGFSNKIGTPTFHEHNDGRVHVEGVVLDNKDVSFESFINVIGGKIGEDLLELPTTEGLLARSAGELCPDGTIGEWNVFLYSVQGKNVGREKLSLTELKEHILAPEGSVPPGDCIILEFSESKSRTDKLCNFYKTAINQGKFNDGY